MNRKEAIKDLITTDKWLKFSVSHNVLTAFTSFGLIPFSEYSHTQLWQVFVFLLAMNLIVVSSVFIVIIFTEVKR